MEELLPKTKAHSGDKTSDNENVKRLNPSALINKKSYAYEKVLEASSRYFDGNEMAAKTWIRSCALKDYNGQIFEHSPVDMFNRLSDEIIRIEEKYKFPIKRSEIYELFKDFKFLIPETDMMRGIGNPFLLSPLSNSFVIGNENNSDSYGGILKTDEEQVQIMKRGGAVAHDLSHIRPKGAPVLNSALSSTGVVPFITRYSNAYREFSKYAKVGSVKLSIDLRHPDSLRIIEEKLEKYNIPHANISFKITSDFLKTLQNSTNMKHNFPVDVNGSPYEEEFDSKDTWNRLMRGVWGASDPGILFWDTMKKESIPDCYREEGFESHTTDAANGVLLSKDEASHSFVLNLYSYVSNPFESGSMFNFELFKKHIKSAVRIADDIVDLSIEKIERIIQKIKDDPESKDIKITELTLWKNIKRKIELGRRIGIGVIGEADMLAALGLTYGSDMAISFSEEVHKTMAIESFRASIKLAEERGAFPVFDFQKEKANSFIKRLSESDAELCDLMKVSGRRNIALMNIAPSGTRSMLSQTSAGYGPIFSPFYKRRRKVNISEGSSEKYEIDELGDAWEEYIVLHPRLKDWLSVKNMDHKGFLNRSEDEINKIIDSSPYKDASIDAIDWQTHLKMIMKIQKWTDQNVYNTIVVPESTCIETISEIYLTAFETGCKSISVYRLGSREKAILKKIEKQNRKIPPRPEVLNADVIRFKNKSEDYIAFVGLLDNKPYEIFTGLDDKEMFPLPLSVTKGEIVKWKDENGKNNYDFQYTDRYGYKNKIGGLHHMFNPAFWNYAKLISGVLRHEMPLVNVVQLVSSLKLDFDFVHSWTNGVKRALEKYIEDETEVKGVCESCGSANIAYQEGCPKCRDCGFGQC